jgi:hypothetical protein
MEVSGQLHSPAALPPEEEPRYLSDRRLDGTQSRSGHGGEERNSQPPPEIEPSNPDRPADSPALYFSTEVNVNYVSHFFAYSIQKS